MSVMVLMITVILRREAVETKYPSGLAGYTASPYVWHDEHLVASSYMNWLDTEAVLRSLARFGIALDENRESPDIAIVDQAQGIITCCDWLMTGKDQSGQRICWLRNTKPGAIVFPKELLA